MLGEALGRLAKNSNRRGCVGVTCRAKRDPADLVDRIRELRPQVGSGDGQFEHPLASVRSRCGTP